MPPFGPINRRELIPYFEELGFEGPYTGDKHQYMVKGKLKVAMPNPHQGDIKKDLLLRVLRQAGISREDWERL